MRSARRADVPVFALPVPNPLAELAAWIEEHGRPGPRAGEIAASLRVMHNAAKGNASAEEGAARALVWHLNRYREPRDRDLAPPAKVSKRLAQRLHLLGAHPRHLELFLRAAALWHDADALAYDEIEAGRRALAKRAYMTFTGAGAAILVWLTE